MLDILGIPWLKSEGEAEATCAALNMKGIVDACATSDGDAFLYGATKVYRNLKAEKVLCGNDSCLCFANGIVQ